MWVPALVAATILGFTILFGAAAGVDGFFIGASVIVLVVVALWVSNAVLIVSSFRFRARDTARLALYYLAARPLVTLGALSLLILAAAIVAFTTDVVLALLAAGFAGLLSSNARRMDADIRERFVAPTDDSDAPD